MDAKRPCKQLVMVLADEPSSLDVAVFAEGKLEKN